ncbi:MAG: ABC transporter substrate-binding protein [Candidatus Omnitrophica bacterium]|nr:Vitamin B12-binding protein [bacterium]NUN95151.1 ABC transporter substrate-binding protein [Candidatus Omnitrophota bacterium]
MIPVRLHRIAFALLILHQSALSASATPPTRALSQVPSITEILFALDLDDRIVGVSTFCRFPPEALQKPKIGGLHDSDLERILALQPDWAALFHGQSKIGDVLTARGCRVDYIDAETIADVYATIRRVGEVFEVPERADKLIESMSREIRHFRDAMRGIPRKRVLYVVGREPGALKNLYGAGRDNFLSEMIEIAGGTNCVEGSLGRYPVLSRESILTSNPEVILDAGATESEKSAQSMPPEWEILATVRAVKDRRVIPIDDPHLTIPGPSIPESIRKLVALIHGPEALQRIP